MLVLALLTERESYGYELVTRLHEGGLDDLSAGTLYPVLNRLERDGQISSRLVASSAGPARKYYVPTQTGTEQLWSTARSWQQLVRHRRAACSPAPPRRSPHEHVVARHPRPRALPDALQLGDAGPPEGQADRARAAHRADRHGGRGRHAAGGRRPRAPPRAGRRLPERARPTGAPLGHRGRLGRARRRRRRLPGLRVRHRHARHDRADGRRHARARVPRRDHHVHQRRRRRCRRRARRSRGRCWCSTRACSRCRSCWAPASGARGPVAARRAAHA